MESEEARKETQNVDDLLDEIPNRMGPPETNDDREFIPSGFEDLDRHIDGFRTGEVTIIGGRPHNRRERFVQEIVRRASIDRGIPTVYFGAESKHEILGQIFMDEARVPLRKAQMGALNESDEKNISRTVEHFEGSPLFIDDRSLKTISRLKQRIEELKEAHNIELVVIDFLQIIRAPEEYGRENEMAKIMEVLKTVSEEQNLAMILLSDIDDGVKYRSDHRPKLIDVGETDEVSRLADLVILLYRNAYYTGNEAKMQFTKLMIAKTNRGPCCSTEIYFDFSEQKFVPVRTEPIEEENADSE
jgi:replicative DNA helicase